MRALWLITKKNLKLLVRAKSSALIVVFAPLLIILILGLLFGNTDSYSIIVGVQAGSFTEDVNSFISTLEENNGFTVVKYESLETCINDIKMGNVHTCISLPESFAIESNNQKEITFHVDPSRMNMVKVVQETIKEKFEIKSQQLSEGLTQNILTKLSNTNSRISGEKSRISSIKEKSSAAVSGSESAKASLSSIDLSSPAAEYDTAVLGAFSSDMNDRLNTSRSLLSDVKDSVDDSELNVSAREEIEELLENADNSLREMSELMAGTGVNSSAGTAGSGFAAVSTLVQQMQVDVESIRNKLTAAADSVSSGVTTLSTISANINEGISALGGLEQSLNEISAELEGQKVTEAGVIAQPIMVKVEEVSGGKTKLSYLFPALLVLVIMFASLLLGTTLVMMEKNSPAFVRNFFLPIKKVTFIVATYLTTLILILVQVIIILAISLIFIKGSYMSLPVVALILFLAASVFAFLGMAVGYIFTSEETGVLASISLGSLFLFVSGVILPVESMNSLFRDILSFSPFIIAEKLIREVFIFQSEFTFIWMDFLILAGYAVVLFLVVLIIESVLHEQLRNRFMRHHHKKHRALQKEKRGI